MNIKDLLESHKKIDDEIELGLEEIARLRSLAERVTQRFTDYCPGSQGTHSDRVGDYAVRIAELEMGIDKKIDRLVDLREKISKMVESLDDITERMILERRYILHESTEVIAERLGYSTRHITRMIAKAVAKLEEIYGKTDNKEKIA